jgi:hypothetical protein
MAQARSVARERVIGASRPTGVAGDAAAAAPATSAAGDDPQAALIGHGGGLAAATAPAAPAQGADPASTAVIRIKIPPGLAARRDIYAAETEPGWRAPVASGLAHDYVQGLSRRHRQDARDQRTRATGTSGPSALVTRSASSAPHADLQVSDPVGHRER